MLTSIPSNFRSFKYIVDVFSVIIDNEVIDIDPKYISTITLEKDFENDAFPIFQVEFSMNDEVYYKILKNKQNTQFKIRIMKYLYDYSNKIRAKRVMLNDVFIAFIDEDSQELDRNLKKQNTDEMQLIANKTLRLFFFKKSDLINTKKYINSVFVDCTLVDVLTYCFVISGIKNVLISPFHNIKRYEEVRIPPLTLVDTIDYLENMYDGFFNKGSIKFFDFDCMYFIDRGPRNNVYRANETTQNVITILDPATSSAGLVSGCIVDDVAKKTYINVPAASFNSNSVSILNEHINGNNAILISPSTGIIDRIEPKINETTGGVYKLLINRFNNSRIKSNYEAIYTENDNVIYLGMQGIDVNTMTPNKHFNVIFEDSKANIKKGGDYRISKINFIFKKEGEEYTLIADGEFKKIR